MSLLRITPVKTENEIKLFVDIFGFECGDPMLTACRAKFKETIPYALDKPGDGLLAMTVDQARKLRDELTVLLEKRRTKMKLTKILYVKVEKDRDPEDDFLIASNNPADLSEAESTIEIGEYKLVRKVKLINATIIK